MLGGGGGDSPLGKISVCLQGIPAEAHPHPTQISTGQPPRSLPLFPEHSLNCPPRPHSLPHSAFRVP